LKIELVIKDLLPDDDVLLKCGRPDELHILQMIWKVSCEEWCVPKERLKSHICVADSVLIHVKSFCNKSCCIYVLALLCMLTWMTIPKSMSCINKEL